MEQAEEKPDPLTETALLKEFRQVLANFEVWMQYGKTARLDPTRGGGGDGAPFGAFNAQAADGDDRGDVPRHVYWREKWREAEENDSLSEILLGTGVLAARHVVWEGAWEDLHARLKQKHVEVKEETKLERDARMIREGEGWSVKDIERHFFVSGKEVRAARARAGRNPETGWRALRDNEDIEDRDYARYLAANGLPERAIAELTGLPKSTVRRAIGRAA